MDLQSLRDLCLSFPGTAEDVKWDNDLCFTVAGKMFCVAAIEGPPKVSFKVRDEEFGLLCETPDIRPADYVARYKWITVEDFGRFGDDEWRHFVNQSYDLIVSKLPRSKRPGA